MLSEQQKFMTLNVPNKPNDEPTMPMSSIKSVHVKVWFITCCMCCLKTYKSTTS